MLWIVVPIRPCNSLALLFLSRDWQAEFWKEMSHHQPSLARLDTIGLEYDECIKKSEQCFALMLRLNPQSVSVMRRYAQFLLEVDTVCHLCAADPFSTLVFFAGSYVSPPSACTYPLFRLALSCYSNRRSPTILGRRRSTCGTQMTLRTRCHEKTPKSLSNSRCSAR